MIKEVTYQDATWNDLPHKFEAGTPPIAEAIGLGAAIDYLSDIGMDVIEKHDKELTLYALSKLEDIDGVTIFGTDNWDNRCCAISFAVEGIHPHDLASLLDEQRVNIRSGHHCCMPLMDVLVLRCTTLKKMLIGWLRLCTMRGLCSMASQMYQEIILDYYKNPRNKGVIENADIVSRDVNTLCGDAISMTLKVEDGIITNVKFEGDGCAISLAATSMLTELVLGKPVESVKDITRDQILEMLKIPISPARVKCALLGLKVLKMGTYKHIGTELTKEEGL
jgi:cysteine desulfurase/selenocysteine lyase